MTDLESVVEDVVEQKVAEKLVEQEQIEQVEEMVEAVEDAAESVEAAAVASLVAALTVEDLRDVVLAGFASIESRLDVLLHAVEGEAEIASVEPVEEASSADHLVEEEPSSEVAEPVEEVIVDAGGTKSRSRGDRGSTDKSRSPHGNFRRGQ